MLRDIGITRGDIPYIGAVVAHDELFMRDLTQIAAAQSQADHFAVRPRLREVQDQVPGALRRAEAA